MKLALYCVVHPNSVGDASREGWRKRRWAYEQAGRDGLYADLDFLVPVLYSRWGVDDSQWDTNAAGAPLTIEPYTSLGLTTTHALIGEENARRAGSSPIDMFPILNFRVNNGGSTHNGVLVKDLKNTEYDQEDTLTSTWQIQIGLIQDYHTLDAGGDVLYQISDFGFWNGHDGIWHDSKSLLLFATALPDGTVFNEAAGWFEYEVPTGGIAVVLDPSDPIDPDRSLRNIGEYFQLPEIQALIPEPSGLMLGAVCLGVFLCRRNR